MDVTPHELRTIELREAWRGYRQDDVDELLDRVATTIEGLQGQVQRLTDRLTRAEEEVGLGKEADEMLRRTLLLAQRTADAAVSEAQERARRLVSEAEAKAATLVNGAEDEARRLSLQERRRLEGEIRDLARTRDALVADVETLERFTTDHRRRTREYLEAELAGLEARPLPEVPPSPVLAEVEMPDLEAEPEPVPEAEPDPDPLAEAEAFQPETEGMSLEALEAELAAASPADLLPKPPEDDHAAADEGPVPVAEAVREPVVDFDDLDDDAYLAELRRAVEDDTPLGPRDEDEPDEPIVAEAVPEPVADPWAAEPDEWTAADRAVLFDQDAADDPEASAEAAAARSLFRRRG